MNFRNVLFQLGLLLLVVSCGLLLIGLWAVLRSALGMEVDRHAMIAMLLSAAVGGLLGGTALGFTWKRDRFLGRREALLLVALSWVVGAAVAGLPFFLWAVLRERAGGDAHHFSNFVDCYFEAMSGLTTTGATVVSAISELPPSLLLWRALTHWMGGLGIVVLFVAVLPSLGVGGKRLFKVEAAGPAHEGLQPTIRETARILWLIYLGLTVLAGFVMWQVSSMDVLDAVCHAMSVMSTGGLSTRDASIGHYDSVALELVVSVFMLLAGVNFALFYLLTQRRFREALRDTELRVYVALKIVVILIVAWNVHGEVITTTLGPETAVLATSAEALRYSTFVTIALHTGTGFCTADYDTWPLLSKMLLIGLMFIGGCGGSTAGGVKVIRFWMAVKIMAAEIEKSFRPHVVRSVRIGGRPVDTEMKLSVLSYLLGFLALFAVGAALVAMFESPGDRTDLLTNMSASLSCLANVGPGLHEIGATKTYAWMTDGSKIVLSLLMALGRLEVFALIVLVTPRFWRAN